MAEKFVTVIIPASFYNTVQTALNAVAVRAVNPIPQVRGMFKTALIAKASPDTASAAAYASSGSLDQLHWDYLVAQYGANFTYGDGTFAGQPETPLGYIDRMGFRLKPGTI